MAGPAAPCNRCTQGGMGLYLAAEGLKDDGWRYQSPSAGALLRRSRLADAEVHLVTSAADNYFGVVGPTPVDLLANDYRAIYTLCGDQPRQPLPAAPWA
jgi:iron complex outermembrane recepter protein